MKREIIYQYIANICKNKQVMKKQTTGRSEIASLSKSLSSNLRL